MRTLFSILLILAIMGTVVQLVKLVLAAGGLVLAILVLAALYSRVAR